MAEKLIWILVCGENPDDLRPFKAFRSKKQAETRSKQLVQSRRPVVTYVRIDPCGFVEKVKTNASST